MTLIGSGINLNMGQMAAGALGGAPLPLDGISNIEAAYSVRRLLTSYAGNLVRLRRDSDNAESNFGYDVNGNLDKAAITTWLAGANGFGVTFYDQSGNGRDAVQATAVNQAQINIAAIPYFESASGDYFNWTGSISSEKFHWSTVMYGGSNGLTYSHRLISTGQNFRVQHNGNDFDVLSVCTSDMHVNFGTLTFLEWQLAGPTSLASWKDGTPGVLNTTNWTDADITGIDLINSNSQSDNGKIQEMIVISSAPISVADHNQIGESVDDYYGITWTTVT